MAEAKPKVDTKAVKQLQNGLAKAKSENESLKKDFEKSKKSLLKLKTQYELQKKKHDERVAKMDKDYRSNAEAHRKVLKDLEKTRTELENQKNSYTKLKT